MDEQPRQGPIVRKAREADAGRVSLIHNEAIASDAATMQEAQTSVETAQRIIKAEDDRTLVLVVEDSGMVCGWGRLWPYSAREGYRFAAETAIFIDSLFRNRGFGTMLQTALIENSRRMGYHHLVAKIFADNAASIQLHVKLGYEVVGVQREIGYKKGTRKDVAILQYVHPDD